MFTLCHKMFLNMEEEHILEILQLINSQIWESIGLLLVIQREEPFSMSLIKMSHSRQRLLLRTA